MIHQEAERGDTEGGFGGVGWGRSIYLLFACEISSRLSERMAAITAKLNEDEEKKEYLLFT